MLHHIRSVSVHLALDADMETEDFIKTSARLSVTFDILKRIRAAGERALVFIEHRRMQHRFIELAKVELGLKKIDLINGDTPIKKRHQIVNNFQKNIHENGGFDVLVLGPKAAGTGLTLTAATHVIHLSRWWNPAVEEQCNDRVHRLGQTREVTIHIPLAIHPNYREQSFDLLLQSLMQRKRQLAASALWPMGDSNNDIASLASHCKPSTQYEYRRCVDLFIMPKLGTLKIIDVTRADVVELHQSLKETPYQANRVLGVLSIIFTLADTCYVRSDGINPCWKVKRYKEVKRERYLTPDELSRLGKVLREADGELEATTCIRLLLLTGCRQGEIQNLKWEYVDFRAGVLRLRDSKTGAKVVPIGKTALDVLSDIPRIEGNPHVVIGKVEGQYLTDIQKPWRRIRARAGLDTLRIHDLRHSFASDALLLGADLTMIGRLLGHAQVQTTARYAHLKTDPIRKIANDVADAIAHAF